MIGKRELMRLPVLQEVWTTLGGGQRRRISSAAEIRQSFVNYFVQNEHVNVPSSSVVPEDKTLLFTTAGMNQFKPIFIGENNHKWTGLTKAVSHQKCIRAGGKHNDLDDVGRDLHHQTFFEMLGNWSFNSAYGKEKACRLAWNYLVDVLKIDPSRLYITYFGGMGSIQADLECKEIWERIGVPSDRIIPGYADNFWEMGYTGPCGMCTEIHYDRVASRGNVAHLVNKDNSVIELWNIVFMNMQRKSDGTVELLPNSHVDTGMGFERLVSVVQDVSSNYDTDLFQPLIKKVAEMSRHSYSGTLSPSDGAIRLISDHIRACTVAMKDGAVPSGTGAGFIVRRMLRRAFLQSATQLKMDRGALPELVPLVVETLDSGYPELAASAQQIQQVIGQEEQSFWRIVDKGRRFFDKKVAALGPDCLTIPGQVIWDLHNGHGLTVEITRELAREMGKEIDSEGFLQLKEQARELSQRTSSLPQQDAKRAERG